VNIFIATIQDQAGLLTSEESWHCAKVLRKKAGETVHLIDGKGNFYVGVLSFVSEKQCRVDITNGPVLQPKRNYYLHLVIAPTKQIDRIEWMVEKAVEIGVSEISFISCKNSERTTIKTDRIEKIVESAVKQSLQAIIPKVNGLVPFRNAVNNIKADQKLIAHCFEAPKKDIKEFSFIDRSNIVLIGPEGDFTEEETEYANLHQYEAVSLGTNRLRTETAGLYVCQALALLT
jgi:16S rRNA (uracil1498-N3)-methyltransferase